MNKKKAKTRGFKLNKYLKIADKGTTIDMPILIITIILVVFGLVMLYSASYVVGIYRKGGDSTHYVKDQILYAVVGIICMFIASGLDYRIFKRYTKVIMILSYVLLIIVLFMPEINHAKRWIVIKGLITFQPSEIAKFAVILTFAYIIQKKGNKMKTFTHGALPFGVILASVALLLLLEPHISATCIILAIGVIMMFIGGTDKKWFIIGIVSLICAIVLIVIFVPSLVPRAMQRINAWQNPELDLQGSGYQSYHSLIAIGSGGLMGLGLGNSRQKHLHLPEPQNDFIFAVICEELGFIGGVIVIMLFLALFMRGIYIASKARDKFGAMLVVGIISQITIQALLNIAVATNTIPNTGISLPFFSEGGTSLLMILSEIGVVLSVSRYANLEKEE